MKRSIATLLPALLALAAPSCTSVPATGGDPRLALVEDAKPPAVERQAELDELQRKIDVQERKLHKAELEQESTEAAITADRATGKVELELVRAKLRQYVERDAPAKLAQAELDLGRVKDRAQEAADELAQIEIMYEGQDLDDRTAEFVIQRGRRNAERSAAQIELQERALQTLVSFEVPHETARLELEVSKKEDALLRAERDAASRRIDREIAVMNERAELQRLRRELAEAKAKPADGGAKQDAADGAKQEAADGAKDGAKQGAAK